MRKLLNTLYVMDENTYLSLNGNNVVCRRDEEELLRVPFDILEAIVCFTYSGCSPALMGKCMEKGVSISFLSPYGKFLGRVATNTQGNAAMRINQIDLFRAEGLKLAQKTIDTKLRNTLALIGRSLRNKLALRNDAEIRNAISIICGTRERIETAPDAAALMGMEGKAASAYFGILRKLFSIESAFYGRNRRPPLDPVNAALSFMYAILTNEYVSALETVGIDPQIGYYHALHPGRESLACDMMEETRCIVDRFVLTLFDRRELTDGDFHEQENGIYLNKAGCKKILKQWQERKRKDIYYSGVGEKIPLGLLPYAQCCLLGKYLRNETDRFAHFRYRG